MQIGGGVAPFPFADDDIARNPGGPVRFGKGQLAFGDPRRPIGEQSESARGLQTSDVARHLRLRAARLDAPRPCVRRIVEFIAEHFRDAARARTAERVTSDAAAGLQRVQPSALGLHAPDRKFGLGRNVQHREPIDRRIIFRRGGGTGRRHSGKVEKLPRRGLNLRRIRQPIAAHPDIVIGLRKVGHDVAAAIVRDDDLGELGGKIGGLGNHPDAGFRSCAAGHHAAKVGRTDGHGGVVGLRHGRGRSQSRRCDQARRGSSHSQAFHHLRSHCQMPVSRFQAQFSRCRGSATLCYDRQSSR